jgi:hypothetical protein
MDRRNNNDDRKGRNKRPDKSKIQASKHDEDFNTGSHSPLSLLKVGAGYDATGMGNGSQDPAKNVDSSQKQLKGNTQKIRKVINTSRKSR